MWGGSEYVFPGRRALAATGENEACGFVWSEYAIIPENALGVQAIAGVLGGDFFWGGNSGNRGDGETLRMKLIGDQIQEFAYVFHVSGGACPRVILARNTVCAAELTRGQAPPLTRSIHGIPG